jgi:hypothetical protein
MKILIGLDVLLEIGASTEKAAVLHGEDFIKGLSVRIVNEK